MLARLAARATAWSTRFVPDAFVIAILLSALVFALALGLTPHGAGALSSFWAAGLWELNGFAMQMCLVVLTGYIVAVSPPVSRLLDRLAGCPKSPRQAVALMAVASMIMALLNWGLSIVGSAVLARALARRVRGLDYRLLVASAYLGLGCLWHAGLSATAPLLSATPGNFTEKLLGQTLSIESTLLSPLNVGLAVAVLVIMPVLAAALHPRPEDTVSVDPELLRDSGFELDTKAPSTPAEAISRHFLASALLVVAGCYALYAAFADRGAAALNIDTVNLLFLLVGLALHGRPTRFLKAAEAGGGFLWAIVIQFPLYAGIFGLIKGSGLGSVIATSLVGAVDAEGYPMFVLWYSGLLNYVVPSGGAKWGIEAPYVIEAAKTLGVSLPTTITAYAWGDMLTDIIQPFWAIPLLSVARLGFRDIMGYCILFFVVYATLVTAGFALA
ncbi:MAG: short-chain fatty acid transporter [Myxococcales bacterium]|nr:short-chain fatty acid transporter [Myxococcales bacterium]